MSPAKDYELGEGLVTSMEDAAIISGLRDAFVGRDSLSGTWPDEYGHAYAIGYTIGQIIRLGALGLRV